MKIRILGGGWYGCAIAKMLRDAWDHDVVLCETAPRLFNGASGGNPARLHIGPHYPRSALTRAACRQHHRQFMDTYGFLTRCVPVNLYAIAAHESMMDIGTYVQVLKNEIELIQVAPEEYGLTNCEGAILCGERHIVIDLAREYFTRELHDITQFNQPAGVRAEGDFDWTIDCTFCAYDPDAVDRFEPCVTGILEGPTDKAVTIMDGPFGSIYPWDEDRHLLSLTSAKFTPFSKDIRSYAEAQTLLNNLTYRAVMDRCRLMQVQMAHYWPDSQGLFRLADAKLSIRAMPRSAADSRLVDVVQVDNKVLRVRAGKIDAIFHAAFEVGKIIHQGKF